MKLTRRTLLYFSAAGVAQSFPNTQAEAPRFRGRSMDGEAFDNSTLLGKVVVIQLWATWCGYCRRDQPAVDEVVSEYGKEGLVVLAVNVGEAKRKVQQYLEKSPRQGRIVLMEDTNLVALFRPEALPHYVAINRAGKVAKEQRGAGGAAGLEQLLKAAGLG